MTLETKKCSVCLEVKFLSCFWKRLGNYQAQCKACKVESQREYRSQLNKEKAEIKESQKRNRKEFAVETKALPGRVL